MRRAFQCTVYEAQDVLRDHATVDLIELEPGRWFWRKERLLKRAVYHDFSKQLVFLNPGLRRARVDGTCDVFMAFCQNHWDLLYINAIDRWWEKCGTSVCWLDEMWAIDVPNLKNWMNALKRFDHVFVSFSGTVDRLSAALDKRCHYLPLGIDTLGFSPYPDVPPRVIDVFSVGRRSEAVHEALVRLSSERQLFYAYDTLRGMADLEVEDPARHRQYVARLAKRSRYFVVAPAKVNTPLDTGGQQEFGYRYYEAAAAGAVMIGQAPDTDAFRASFPWPDSVIPIRPDGSDVREVIAGMEADPARTAAIGRRNAAEALRRHDWSHRWQELLKTCGLEIPAGLTRRSEHLAALSDLVLAGGPVPAGIDRTT